MARADYVLIKNYLRILSVREGNAKPCSMREMLLLLLLGMMVQHPNQALVEVQATLETMGNCF